MPKWIAAGSVSICMFCFLRKCLAIFQGGCIFKHLLSAIEEGSILLTSIWYITIFFLISTIIIDMYWYPIVLIFVFLTANDAEYFSFAICVFSSVKCFFTSFANFLIEYLTFIIKFRKLFTYFRNQFFIEYVICKCFLPSLVYLLILFIRVSMEQKF